MSKTTLKWLIGVSLLILVMLVAAMAVIKEAEKSRSDLPVIKEVPQFAFTERSGQPFSKEDMLGKINVVMFGFTNCKGPCPTMSGNYAELYELYDSTEQVQLVWISVDPDRDTLAQLQAYASEYGVVDDRWVFLRSDVETTTSLSEDGFLLPAENLPAMHSTRFVLVDHKGRIRGYYSGTDDVSIATLKTHIRELLQQMPA